MIKLMAFPHTGRNIKQVLLIGCLVVLVGIFLPAQVLAGPPEPSYEGPEKCAGCHLEETEAWKDSPHAQAMKDINEGLYVACTEQPTDTECNCLSCHTTDFDPADNTYAYEGVECEACHGPYVEGHPANGMMQLDVDSSVCSDCHVETYEQWSNSPHSEANVQCIGCHLSHSQEFRLTDEALCGSCHRDQIEDFAHTSHDSAEVTCTDCHLSSASSHDTSALASVGLSIGGSAAPSHGFTVVSSQACVNCHGQTIHEEISYNNLSEQPQDTSQAANVRLLALAERVPELTEQLEAVEKTNKTLQIMPFVSLGLGLGAGSLMGIIFMLAFGYITQRRAKE